MKIFQPGAILIVMGGIMRKNTITKKQKNRFLVLGTIVVFIMSFFSYNMYLNFQLIETKEEEKLNLETQLVNLELDEILLQDEVVKLEDDEYIARYARERYLYSKDGEMIIVLPKDEE